MVIYDPTTDTREQLKKLLELTEENNKFLKRMDRRSKWASVGRIIYWLIILGSIIGAYYYLQPYMSVLEKNLPALSNALKQIGKLGSQMPGF